MFEDKTPDNIHSEILNNILDDYEKTAGYPTYDITRSFAIAGSLIYKALTDIVNKVNVDNLTGDELERYTSQRKGITRKPANLAKGSLTVNGIGIINSGALFETSLGIQFRAAETKNINGTGVIDIEAVTAGAEGNVPANAITQIPVTIAGITSVTNSSATYDGYDAEGDDSLRERYYEALRQPPTSGNKYHYLTWAKEVVGVGDAVVYPLWNGDNTVKVVIIDENRQPANEDLIGRTQEYIDPLDEGGEPQGNGSGQAPVGAYCTVESAMAKEIIIKVKAAKASDSYTDQQIIDNMTANIQGYFKDIALSETNNYISFAKVGSLILASEGVGDYSELTINDLSNNIPLILTSSLTEIPILVQVILL